MSSPERSVNLGDFAGLPMPAAPGEMVTWGEGEDSITFTRVNTPRVGVDGLREILAARYGTVGNPPEAEQLGATGEE